MKSILVIDDNADLRENTAEILELAGYKVLTAENGKKGVDAAIKEVPDTIVCDIMMPELDGYGVLHMLRKHPATQNIPFIFLTAKTERGDFRKGMEMGADDYITKPFDDLELLNAVETRLKKAEILGHKYADGSQGVNEFIRDIRESGLIAELAEKYESQQYEKKTSVYQEGKRPRYLYYILSGKVKAFKIHEDGKEYITDLFSTGDFVGYSAIIDDRNYDDNAVVLENAELLQVPKEDFLRMVYGDISIAAKFIKLTTQNVKEKEERMLNLAYSSLRKRVANALLTIYDKFKAGNESSKIAISREELAQYIGTATESLIRTLGDFKAENRIEIVGGKITIPEPGRLKNLVY